MIQAFVPLVGVIDMHLADSPRTATRVLFGGQTNAAALGTNIKIYSKYVALEIVNEWP